MSPLTTDGKTPFWTGVKQTTSTILKWFLAAFIIFLCGFIYWKFYFTYSEGYRAGLLQKFSSKGALFKTYEGEMILSSVSSSRDVALASEKFLFSMTNKSLVRQFDTLQGDMVIVHYRQKERNSLLAGRYSVFS